MTHPELIKDRVYRYIVYPVLYCRSATASEIERVFPYPFFIEQRVVVQYSSGLTETVSGGLLLEASPEDIMEFWLSRKRAEAGMAC